MQHFPPIHPGKATQQIGSEDETTLPASKQNSDNTSDSLAVRTAKPIVDWLIGLIEIPDQLDPADYITMAVKTFAEYPRAVMINAARSIVQRTHRPYIDDLAKVLDEIYAPIRREEERKRALLEGQRCLPPPNPYVAPERRHHLVLQMRQAFGIPETGLPRKHGLPPPPPTDPYYSRRLADDLETRRVRNELLAQELQQKEQTNDSRPTAGPEP